MQTHGFLFRPLFLSQTYSHDKMADVMKKLKQFLQSMTFGLILLGLIVVLSVIGSVIPQNEPVMTYVRAYPSLYQVIFALQLNTIFTSWYFILLSALLCINLFFCSIIRIRKLVKIDPLAPARADLPMTALTEQGVEKVKEVLRKNRCKEENGIFYKNLFGRYGSFLTHLGILLTVIFWGLAMYLPTTIDSTCMPKEYVLLEDGTRIGVDSFSIEDADGKLDYSSVIKIVLPDGRESDWTTIKVNHPASFHGYAVYQQTYGTTGRITVKDNKGNEDSFYVDANDFLSADGENGILYDNLYPGIDETDGKMTLITNTTGSYPDPVYVFTTIVDQQQQEVMLAFPGDEYEIGGYTYIFEEPVEYPGLRIKKTPVMVNYLLMLAFLVMTVGLYLTFFLQPVIVKVTNEGYAIAGPKQEGIRLQLKEATRNEVKEVC